MRPQIKAGDKVRFRTDGEIGELNRQHIGDMFALDTIFTIEDDCCQRDLLMRSGSLCMSASSLELDICNNFSEIVEGLLKAQDEEK